MRILYGIQGTGNGHISRSREVLRELDALGHTLTVLVSGRSLEAPLDLGVVPDPLKREGLTFRTRAGRVRLLSTALNLRPGRLWKDIQDLDQLPVKPDLVITDFEPISAWWARKRGIPTIGLGHQYAFQHPIPVPAGQFAGKLVLKRFAPASCPVGLHWDAFGAPILPPIVPDLPEPDAHRDESLLLVYLPFESRQDITRLLLPLDHLRVRVYGHPSGPPDEAMPSHIRWLGFSRQAFLEDLGRCGGVLCSAGFELPSEVIHMGARLLVKPLNGQVEQEANALAIQELGLGWARRTLDGGTVARWMESALPPRRPWPPVARLVAQWIHLGDWKSLDTLVERCWTRAADSPPLP